MRAAHNFIYTITYIQNYCIIIFKERKKTHRNIPKIIMRKKNYNNFYVTTFFNCVYYYYECNYIRGSGWTLQAKYQKQKTVTVNLCHFNNNERKEDKKITYSQNENSLLLNWHTKNNYLLIIFFVGMYCDFTIVVRPYSQ